MSEHDGEGKKTGAGAVVGAAVGGVAAGATTGALAGGITGPVGAAIGAAVGAVIGAVSGRAGASSDDSSSDSHITEHSGTLDQDSIAPRGSSGTASRNSDGTLEVVEEQLQVGKREVDHGGVRVVQRVTEKPVHETVRLHEEHAVVDRHPVDRAATSADFRDATLEVRETAEQAVVAKTARVVEEVRVGKEVREREEVIEDTLRRKDVDIERLSPGNARSSIERERAVAADDSMERSRKNSDKPL